jgi:uncharacterized repeat protein (TIGR02543 family)
MPVKVKMKAALILGCLCHLALLGIQLEAQEVNSIQRIHDAIVVQGAALPDFLGKPVGDIRVYRFLHTPGWWEPIPFQVDELDGTGSYFGVKNGILDSDDEVVFLARDLGDLVPDSMWVDDEEATYSGRYVFTAEDPLAPDQRGWAYIYVSSQLPKSENVYVRYEAPPGEDDWVETDSYRIVHGSNGFQGSVYLKTSAGGDDIDFMDRQKLRFNVRIDLGALGSKTIVIKEEMDEDIEIIIFVTIHARARRKSYEYLPGCTVRQHRKMVLKIEITGSQIDDVNYELPFETTFYPTYTDWASGSMEIPEFSGGQMKEIRLSTDLNSNSYGMIFTNTYNAQGVRVNGVSSAYNNTLVWPGQNWYLIVADPAYSGAVLQNASIVTLYDFRADPIPNTTQRLYFKDNSSRDGGDTGDRKSYGDTGVQINGNNVHGRIDYYTASYYLPANLDTTEAKAICARHFTPLTLTGRAERLTYTLTVDTEPPEGGYVQADPAVGLVFAGSSVTLSAIANPGYTFAGWSGDASGAENPLSFTMTGDTHITARFVRIQSITVDTQPSGLSFLADDLEYTSPYTFNWIVGSSHRLVTDSLQHGDEGYRYLFVSWNDSTRRSYDYIVPHQDEDILARFQSQVYLTTAVSPEGAGDVIPTPPGAWLSQDTVVQVRAIPAPYYAFFNWTGDLAGWNNPDSVLMDRPRAITAVFGNYGPLVAAPDTSLAEDDTLSIDFVTIMEWIQDENNDDSTLTVDIRGGSRLSVSVDSTRGYVQITNRQIHWNGVDTVFITASDPLNAVGFDDMVVRVTPTPDPPEPFILVEPEDGTVYTQWPTAVNFLWEPSYDPDIEDRVTYVFEIDTTRRFDSPKRVQMSDIQVPSYRFVWPDAYVDGRYFWRIAALDAVFSPTLSSDVFQIRLSTGRVGEAPSTFVLDQNYPNPFNDATTIRYGVPRTAHISLVVYNSQGRRVRTLLERVQDGGYFIARWDGRDDEGEFVATGVYFLLLRSGSHTSVKKTVLLR